MDIQYLDGGIIDLGSLVSDAKPEQIDSDAFPSAAPVLPLRDVVVFPGTLTPLAVGQERSIKLVNDVLSGDRTLALVTSRDPSIEVPGIEDLYQVGVLGVIARMLKVPDGTLRILVQTSERVELSGWVTSDPYLVSEIEPSYDQLQETPELSALVHNVRQAFSNIVEQVPYLPEELQLAVANVDDPSSLSHLIASSLRIKISEKQALLEQVDVAKRLRRLSEILTRELDVISLGTKIQSQVQSELETSQREYFLRQQMKAIQEELGESDEMQSQAAELRQQLEQLDLPTEVRRQVDRELSRLERTPVASAEHGVIRTFLEWIVALPWNTLTEDNLKLRNARKVLDEDHYGIEQVKDRIVEFLAVRKLKPDARGTILCFVGPPGVGKTSLGRSIARALGRKFERVGAGGVRDEAEIRGHRRTYIGAMPGVIIRALRDAQSRNPLLMIDEIDKLGGDFRGDPASALLEVLDPEQNDSFRDHYLDLPFDLSKVMFITTANSLSSIPGPLLDRMEVINLSGYTAEEKLQIAKRYLVPRQIERNGLSSSQISFSDAAIKRVISDYTREAGVRNLERELGAVCRKVARQVAEGRLKRKLNVSAVKVTELLGKAKFVSEVKRRTGQIGVSTGLAWTPVGGDVLYIEAAAMPGTGKLLLTGQLGDVMRESAQAALSYVRGHLEQLAPKLDQEWFAKHDLHLHVPAGAVPKDGPSAGITIATALVSLLSGRRLNVGVAMTGELTLTGQVLPIGGLKEKALAAQRMGIKTVIAPSLNRADVDEIPAQLRERLDFKFVSHLDEVLEVALRPSGPTSSKLKKSRASNRKKERHGST